MKRYVIGLLSRLDRGKIDVDEFMKNLRGAAYPDGMKRVSYIKEHYWFDRMVTKGVFNKNSGKIVDGKTVHCGKGQSPVPVLRAKWFLLMGDDPYQVRTDMDGRMYALYEKDGERVYEKT